MNGVPREGRRFVDYEDFFVMAASVSASIPVLALTRMRSKFPATSSDFVTYVPTMAARKPSGIETIPGFVSGNNASPIKIAEPSGAHTFGLMAWMEQ